MIGSKTPRESLDIDIVQAFHRRVSEVGELFAAPDSVARADETVSSLRRVSGLGLTLQGMLQAQAEDALLDPPDKFCETLVSHGPAMFMEVGEGVAARCKALVGCLRVAVEVGLPKGRVEELEEIVLGECVKELELWNLKAEGTTRLRIVGLADETELVSLAIR